MSVKKPAACTRVLNHGLVVSVISHGHFEKIHLLLSDLARLCYGTVSRVVLTLNLPEPVSEAPEGGWPFELQIRSNTYPMGFGANHNRALAGATEDFVCVLNPDVQLMGDDPFSVLVQSAAREGVGCVYPEQLDEKGRRQDSERELPTPRALLLRHALGHTEVRVDWVNAACLMLPQPVWQTLGGFDESYFMYCEDVDLCLRLRLAGLSLVRAPTQVVHAGQRASHRRWAHLRWHVLSLLRLWRSPTYREARQLLRSESEGAVTIGPS